LATYRISIPILHKAQQLVQKQASKVNIVACGRRWGKTIFGITLVISAVLAGNPVGWFAPTYKYLDDAMRQLKERLKSVTKSYNGSERRLELINGAVIEGWSLTNEDAGRSRKYALVVIDEAAMVPGLMSVWDTSISATLIDFDGDAWFLSSPKGLNDFHRLYLRGQGDDPDYKSWRFGTASNTMLRNLPAIIERFKRRMPERVFRQEILAEFMEDSGGVFRGVRQVVSGPELRGDGPHYRQGVGPYSMGVDLARKHDFTVISVMDSTGRQVAFERFNQISWRLQADRVEAMASRFPGVTIVIDANSIGDPFVEELTSRGLSVVPYIITNKSKKTIVEGLAIDIENRDVDFMNVPQQVSELQKYEYDVTDHGTVTMNAPKGEDEFDDCVIANCLANYGQRLVIPTRYTDMFGSRTGEDDFTEIVETAPPSMDDVYRRLSEQRREYANAKRKT
jgi:hypothetical protein